MTERPILPGRLERLAEELAEEGVPALVGAEDELAALVELAYAMRPPVHEGRVPTYGAILAPVRACRVLDETGDVHVQLIDVSRLDSVNARTFADGMSTFAVREGEVISHIACFDHTMVDEYDVVGVQTMTGGLVIQRHESGQVRVFGPAGVVRWDGIDWYHEPPIDQWLDALRDMGLGIAVDDLRPLLRFAVHELSSRRIGATLLWRPSAEPLPHHLWEPTAARVPRLRLTRVGEATALAHALAQSDGAAVFDDGMGLSALGVQLTPTPASRTRVARFGGTRHTSALRYTEDDPAAIAVVVSGDGPVTIMHRGRAVVSGDTETRAGSGSALHRGDGGGSQDDEDDDPDPLPLPRVG